MVYRILIDTNILIDYMAKRDPFYEAARSIIERCATGELKGCMAAHSVTNAFFILRNGYTVRERCEMLLEMSNLLDIIPIHNENIVESLQSYPLFVDIEDCLQVKCAQAYHADYIVTRNPKHFIHSTIPTLTSDELLQKLGLTNND